MINYRLRISIDELDYNYLMNLLNIKSLEKRREQYDAILLYKLLNNLINCDELVSKITFFVPGYITRNAPLFRIKTCSKNYLYNSPINRILRLGNNLSVDWNNTTINEIKRNI